MMPAIKIAGAGPAGLVAARELAENGFDVTVYEKEKGVGVKWAETFQAFENVSRSEDFLAMLKRVGVAVNFYCVPKHEIFVYGASLRATALRSKEPFWYLVKRGTGGDTVDQGLRKQAEEAGAKIVFGKIVKPGEVDIVATGGRHPMGVAKELSFESDVKERFDVILDNKIAPLGYAYLFVQDYKGTIATAVVKDFYGIDRHFKASVEKFQKIAPFEMRNAHEKTNTVSFFIPETAKKGDAMYVGEAAGFLDFLFGFGLRYAIMSGHFAARSIIDGGDYDELWKKEFLGDLELGVLNRTMYEKLGNVGFKLFTAHAKRTRDFRDYLAKWYGRGLGKDVLARFAKFATRRHPRDATHELPCLWCRPRGK